MTIQFSQHPGIYERDQQRRYNNPLFTNTSEITSTTVEDARLRDKHAHEAFMVEFQALVQQIIALDNEAESQTVLDLKTRLDKSFETSSTLPGDLSEIRSAIQKLMQPIMRAVQVGAGDDQTALAKLEDEDNARSLHFTMLEIPLIAHILSSESPIKARDLPAALLSEDPENLTMVLSLFTPEQQIELKKDCIELVNQMKEENMQTEFCSRQLELISFN